MGIIVPEGFFQATMIWSVSGSVSDKVCTLGLTDGDVGGRTPSQCAEDVYESVRVAGSLWIASGSYNEWTFQGVSAFQMTEDGPIVGEFMDSDAGTASGEAIPTNCAILVKKNTALGGRKNRGRFYWPPYHLSSSNVTSAGVIEDVELSAFQDIWDTFYDELVSRDWAPTLFHSDATTPTGITGFSVESRLATQRRRMRS